MTQTIDTQVENVATMIQEMVSLMEESVNHANTSAKQLADVVESTNTMAQLSEDVEKILVDFKEELGVGGFMGIKDIQPGMRLILAEGSGLKTTEYKSEVIDISDDCIIVSELINKYKSFSIDNTQNYCARVVVNNEMYQWNDVKISINKNGSYVLKISGSPAVANRRKYPRIPLNNTCTINLTGTGTPFYGKLVNISANGIGFTSRSQELANIKGEFVKIQIDNFAPLNDVTLAGRVIRVSDNDGEFHFGCRLLEDNQIILDYVNENYTE